MFEKLLDRVKHKAERRVRARISNLTDQAQAELPRGIETEAEIDGIRISGRAIKRRFALDPWLRWLVTGLLK